MSARNPNVLFIGTETGLFVSANGGTDWTRFAHGFPTVPVDDLVIHPRDNDLIVATHGRALYILDDISLLSGLTADVAAADLHLFSPRPATIIQRFMTGCRARPARPIIRTRTLRPCR